MITTNFPVGGVTKEQIVKALGFEPPQENTQGINILSNSSECWEQGGLNNGNGTPFENNARIRSKKIPVIPNTYYTLSCDVIGSAEFKYEFILYAYGKDDDFIKADYAGSWKSSPITFETDNNVYYVIIIVKHSSGDDITPDEIGTKVRIKLERGIKPTEWTPAPEDVMARLDALEKQLNPSHSDEGGESDLEMLDAADERAKILEQNP